MLLKRTESPSLYHSFLAVFTRILTKYIKKFLVLPLLSYLLPLLFLPSEGVKSAIGTTFSCSKGIFSPPFSVKNNPAFLVIFAWVM